jgi:hypothetical protein
MALDPWICRGCGKDQTKCICDRRERGHKHLERAKEWLELDNPGCAVQCLIWWAEELEKRIKR